MEGMIFKYLDMQENCSANCIFRLHSARRYVKPKMCDSEAALGRKKGTEGTAVFLRGDPACGTMN